MNVHPHRLLLEQLGALYGSGQLPQGNGLPGEAAIAQAMDSRVDAATVCSTTQRMPRCGDHSERTFRPRQLAGSRLTSGQVTFCA